MLVLTAKNLTFCQFVIETFYHLLKKERSSSAELFHSVLKTQDWLLILSALEKEQLYLLLKSDKMELPTLLLLLKVMEQQKKTILLLKQNYQLAQEHRAQEVENVLKRSQRQFVPITSLLKMNY